MLKTINQTAADLGPSYHDFSWLGLPTTQIEGIYAPNQRAKAPVIAAYILLAFARLRCRGIDAFLVPNYSAPMDSAMLAGCFARRRVGLMTTRRSPASR
jgi:hypothetical protein